MTPADGRAAGAALLKSTARQVEAALDDLARIVGEASGTAARISAAPADVPLLLGGGTILHGFYNEIEKVFRTVAETLNGFEPSGEVWHARLLDQMFVDVPGVRPAVLPDALKSRLRDYLGFRHRFRHIYVFDLDAKRVLELLDDLPRIWSGVRAALADFAGALRAMGDALEKS